MRARLREVAAETLALLERGDYPVDTAVAGTRLYLPSDALPPIDSGPVPLSVEVTNETSLAAARRFDDPACLNFASARHPGGGFQSGAQAQEESLARGSGLYPCLLAAPGFYARTDSLLYADRVIYSPAVPVFRGDRDELLPSSYPVSFLTAAAPNRAAIARSQPDLLPEVPATLHRRARRVLAVAAAHGHRTLVLGAWGCGVFGNDPALVASVFAGALRDCPWFSHVVFAVLDRQAVAPAYTAFAREFKEQR